VLFLKGGAGFLYLFYGEKGGHFATEFLHRELLLAKLFSSLKYNS